MTLNLRSARNVIERAAHGVGEEYYEVYPAHPAFQYLLHACLSVTAMTMAVCMCKGINVPEDGYLGLSGKGFDYTIKLPGHNLVDITLQEIEPPFIPITIEWRRKPDAHAIWALGIRRWMDQIVWPGFVELYEHNQQRIHRGTPAVADMAKLIRDSCAHGGRIANRSFQRAAVELNGLTIKPDDRNKPLSDFVMLGDLFILAMQMCDSFVDHSQ